MIHMIDYVLQIKSKNITVKIFNLMPGVNETRFLVQHETRKCNEIKVYVI